MHQYCKNCADRIDSNVTICPSCGAVIDRSREAARRKIFLLILGILAFAVAAVLAWAVLSSRVGPKSYLDRLKKSQSQAEFVIAEDQEPIVLWEENGVTIFLRRVGKSSEGRAVKLHIENSTNQDIAVFGRNFVVNGIAVAGNLYTIVPAEWQTDVSLEFDQQVLEDADITKIATLHPLDSRITNSRTNELLADVFFEIRTDIADTYVQEIDESGQILYDEDGVKVICKFVRDSSRGKEVLLLLRNETDQDLNFREKNFRVNGIKLGGSHFNTVEAGTSAIGSKIFLKNDLEDCGIHGIKAVTFDMEYWGSENFQQITRVNDLQAVFGG